MQIIRILRYTALPFAYSTALLFFCALVFSSYQSFLATRSLLAFGLVVINALFLVLFIARRSARCVSDSPSAWALSLACTILPMMLRPDGGVLPDGLAMMGHPMQLIGAGLIAAALLSLRRSFGVVAAHRGIQTGGLYRWVRHPLYASELLFLLGFTLAHASLRNAFLWVLVAGFQVLRARLEERLLARDPAYRAYRRRCIYRFLPGIW